MPALTAFPLWLHFFSRFVCHGCGGERGYVSRPRTFSERCVLPLFLLRPVRCGDCYHRSLRPISVPLIRRDPAVFANH